MSLQNLQAEFLDILLSDTNETDGIIHPIKNSRIYRNNIQTNLIKALQHTYPLITKLLGEDFFHLTAKEYIKRYPSRSSNLNDYGEYFQDFLDEYPPVKNLTYLHEVALFEWTCHLIYSAADAPLFEIKKLESISPENHDRLRFTLHPASQLIKFYYPILRIIELCHDEVDDNIDLQEGGVHLLIIRRETEISLVPCEVADFAFLTALQENQTLAEALDIALKINPHFKLDEKLPLWIQNKTLVDCHLTV